MTQMTATAPGKVVSATFPKEYKELVAIWESQPYEPLLVDSWYYMRFHPTLAAVLHQAPCVTWVLDLRTQQYDFVSTNSEQILGYTANYFTENGLAGGIAILNPEDLSKTWKLLKNIWDFIMAVPAPDRVQYKFSYDYRILKPDGKHLRVLEQNTVLQQDRKGNITRMLGMCSDISNWKKSGNQIASVVSAKDNSCVFFSPDKAAQQSAQQLLSKRELEIVKLVAEGYSSKIIAEKLFISFNTVNTHRQKIIEKTHTRNTGGLVQFAISNGLI
ncbi:LuxR C-terminal-related transcriptional regulator [Pontibacter sp. SGAir0037]|uniref:LuxR C-terminal-related transcriptional regulator n=1 Tax=Pontibacter sp. SGAir0037 TaxID=2571030 RepID=UPI0010CCD77C|nr:LuxR C-terminal-related transcriptional regulator [Pontibacter sp. SGAir0037]QCR21489.1 hypothetical protein C1N53_03425 [Pontibacter sp. SGAir0037]